MAKVLTLSGSNRKNSHNMMLARAVGRKLAARGHEVENIDLGDFPMDLFSADLEKQQGKPEAAVKLAEMFSQAGIIFIASPEYNGSLSPLLKNTLDWVSRHKIGPYSRAVFGIGAASSGHLGGLGGLGHLRDILNKMGALVAPASLGIGNARDAFDNNGDLARDADINRVDVLVEQLHTISRGTGQVLPQPLSVS